VFESAAAALEVILLPGAVGGLDAYEVPPDRRGGGDGVDGGGVGGGTVAPADVFTVWGDGRVDLNRASPAVLAARLRGWTDAQVAGVVRLRGGGGLRSTDGLAEALSLSEDQARTLDAAATVRPTAVELLVHVRRGGLSSLYHVVVDVAGAANGRAGLLEARPIQ
jgi:hypothetical protein